MCIRDRAYAGLQLQLLIYLAAAAKKRGALAAGAFYFRMDEGYILTPETDPAAVAELRRKALRCLLYTSLAGRAALRRP